MEDLDLNNSYWFFTNVSKHELEEGISIIKFESGRDFKGQENDKVVFLTYNDNGYLFSHEAMISSTKRVKFDLFNSYSFSITIKNIKNLGDKNYLDNYIYSLARIKDFSNPIKHFSFPYGGFEQVEYEALIKKDFFITRTKFGKYVNALPKEHKIAFIKYFIEVNFDLYFSDSKDFNEALKILEKYIEHRITQPARYIREGYFLLSNLISKEEINRIGFSNSKNQIDYLENQYAHCEEYTNIIDREGFTEGLVSEYKFDDSQYKFEKLFSRTPWPIIID